MPAVYRAMVESNGKPKLGATGRTLGVRKGIDITPSPVGMVGPGMGGMSVSPSLRTLPPHRIPRRLADKIPDASGPNQNRIWCLGSGPWNGPMLTERLAIRPDPDKPDEHGFVEPAAEMGYDDYCAALEATQDHWIIDEL